MKKKIYRMGRLVLEMDPDDGDNPVMVYLYEKRNSNPDAGATFDCAMNTSKVENYGLTDNELDWLATFEEEAEEFYNKYREA